MSITMGQLATRYAEAASQNMPGDRELSQLAQVGVGLVKREIQNVHAVDTGTMLNSTTAEREGKAYLIGPTVDYAVYVALGTSRRAGRPFHVTAAARLRDEAKHIGFDADSIGI